MINSKIAGRVAQAGCLRFGQGPMACPRSREAVGPNPASPCLCCNKNRRGDRRSKGSPSPFTPPPHQSKVGLAGRSLRFAMPRLVHLTAKKSDDAPWWDIVFLCPLSPPLCPDVRQATYSFTRIHLDLLRIGQNQRDIATGACLVILSQSLYQLTVF